MTCQYSSADWRDVLYTCVCKTDGGVADAARFLSERRGVSIHKEALRKKLRGLPGETLDVDHAVLLTEWMQTKANGAAHAHDWLLTLNAQEGVVVDCVPELPEGGLTCEIAALKEKCLTLVTKFGRITGKTAEAAADGRITEDEAGPLLALIRSARAILHRMERIVLQAVEKGRGV